MALQFQLSLVQLLPHASIGEPAYIDHTAAKKTAQSDKKCSSESVSHTCGTMLSGRAPLFVHIERDIVDMLASGVVYHASTWEPWTKCTMAPCLDHDLSCCEESKLQSYFELVYIFLFRTDGACHGARGVDGGRAHRGESWSFTL